MEPFQRKLIFIVPLIMLVIAQAKSQVVQLEKINLCPQSHPTAISKGATCCSQVSDDVIWESNVCKGKKVPCPSGRNCNDYPQECADGYTFSRCSNLASSYAGPTFTYYGKTEGGRRVYEADDKCIWWFKSDRQWQMGPCEEIGRKSSYAHLACHNRCPGSKEWKNVATKKLFTNVEFFKSEGGCNHFGDRKENGKCIELGRGCESASASSLISQSSTAGINAVISNGRYVQRCKWRFRRGQWQCLNANGKPDDKF